jgi:hypothetical protein
MTEHCAYRASYARNTAVAADAHAATAEAQAQARAASERIDAVRAECAGECEAIGDRCAHSRARACSACTAVHSLRIARRKKRASLFGCLLLCHPRGFGLSGSHRIRCRCCAVLHVRLEVSAQSLAISEQQNRELHAALEGASAAYADRLQHELDAAATEHAAADRARAAERAELVRVPRSASVGVGSHMSARSSSGSGFGDGCARSDEM